MILLLTAGLEQVLAHAPVGEIFVEREDANVLDQVELAGAVVVEHGAERARIAVEEELVLVGVVVVAQLVGLVHGARIAQPMQATCRQTLQRLPHHLAAHAAHVQHAALLVQVEGRVELEHVEKRVAGAVATLAAALVRRRRQLHQRWRR